MTKKQPVCPGRRGKRRGCDPWAGSVPGGGDGSPRHGRRATCCSPSPAWRRQAPWFVAPRGCSPSPAPWALPGGGPSSPSLPAPPCSTLSSACSVSWAQLLPQASGGGSPSLPRSPPFSRVFSSLPQALCPPPLTLSPLPPGYLCPGAPPSAHKSPRAGAGPVLMTVSPSALCLLCGHW